MRRFWKILRRFIFWTFFIGLFLVTTLTVILHIYEDDIKQFAIDKLNENLKTDVEVMDIDLTIFDSFPYATLQFNRVYIEEVFPEDNSHDTLFYAGNLYMHFNVMDLWNEDYNVERVNIENGLLNMKMNKEGANNFDILKSRKDSIKSDKDFQFSLELLHIEDFRFKYSNLQAAQHYELDINEGLFAGDFSKEQFELQVDSDFHIDAVKSGAFAFIQNKESHADLILDINLKERKYTFKDGYLDVEEMPFSINGFVDSSTIDLTITGKEIEVYELANSILIQEDGSTKLEAYNGQGLMAFDATIKGEFIGEAVPAVEANFSIENASLTEPVNNLSLLNINLLGHYKNDPNKNIEKLDFEKFDFNLLQGSFSGNASIDNFDQPIIRSNVLADIDLGAVKKFFRLNQFEQLGGHLKSKMNAEIQLFDPKYRKELFEIKKASGNLNFDNVRYQGKSETIYYTSINGDIIVQDKDASAKDLSIKTALSDFKLNGALKNFVPFVEGSGGLGVIATLESSNFNLNEFLPDNNKNANGPPVVFELPSDLNLNLDLDIKKLDWDNHSFTNIKSKLLMSGSKATAKDVKLNTLGGNVNGWITLHNNLADGNLIEGKFWYSRINIKQLFAEWENFDQTEVTSENLTGTARGNIDLMLGFNPYFSIIEDQIYSKTNLTIENGKLQGMETMRAITDYMRSNKGLKFLLNKHIDKFEDKLMNISFENLSNTIEIKNSKVFIPKMKIASSALDVNLHGWHDFENNIDYHFSFRFRELKSKPEYTEFGKIEDDGLGIVIYLSMSGNLDDPVYGLDKEERKNDIKENMADEKEDIKSMMKTEFGLFKNDTTVQKKQQNKEPEVEFIFYEEGEEQELNPKDTSKSKNKIFNNNFFNRQKKKQEEEEKKDVDIIIDQ
ncbi:MAG: AsmA-like C-terminal region-containing protein [Crocinitomicaceae bacterium]|nr:AsmA-like C-terminal region-containing protein [Crocinitomicaceae bacterium]